MTSQYYTSESTTTLHDFGSVLGRPLNTFFWALTISLVTALRLCVKWSLAATLMIFGLVDFTKLKLHPQFIMIKSATERAIHNVMFVDELRS